MRIITLNVNGIRSAATKGVFGWLAKQEADVICLQEIRAQAELLQEERYHLSGYHCYYQSAKKPGYSGVGIFSKKEPDKVISTLGFALADEEGRYIHLEFGNLLIASVYFPSGTTGEHRQALKYEFMDRYEILLDAYLKEKRSCIICGDWNIAHKPIDLKNWRNNQKNSGFLPEERAWMDKLLTEKGVIDAFREVNQEPDQYTWWSNRARARQNNVGWRIDYQIISSDLKKAVQSASIYKTEQFSDHAPLTMEYGL